jgi:sulfur dioxygenase
MIFKQLNDDFCKTYLIGTEEVVLIDPSLKHVDSYLDFLNKNPKLSVTHIIDTHTHADHLSAGPLLKDRLSCEYVMHKNAMQICASIKVDDGDEIQIGGLPFTFIHTPGHSKDSICILTEKSLFTGDFLFLDDAGGGRDDLPGGNMEDHWESIQKIAKLPDNLIVYPAHEYNKRVPSSLSNQRLTNPHLVPRTKAEFVEYIGRTTIPTAEWMLQVINANVNCTTDPLAVNIPADTHACQVLHDIDINSNNADIMYVSADELYKMLVTGEDETILLDVREKYELNDELGHIKEILHIPLGSLQRNIDEFLKDKNKKIAVICRSGARSITAAKILLGLGFNNVSVLDGGMISWKNGRFPVE